MANIMGILGGLGQGVSAGVQDLERMEEAKTRKEEAQFRKELQQRERERMAEEKRLGEAVKGIKRSREGFTPEQAAANAQVGYTNLPTRDDEGRLVYGATETAVPRSEAEILKEEAALYSASPDIRNRTLGRQLQSEARTLETQDKLKAIQTNYADTLKAINADPNKWVQENLAKFNSDEYGGPGTKGFMAAPMSTPQGTVLNIYGPQGQQASQIPVTRQDMMRVAKSMYLDELSSVNPDYAKLAMQNEQLGLERQGLDLRQRENESNADYRRRMAKVYEDRTAQDKEEFGVKQKSGYFAKAEPAFTPLGLSDDGTKILGRVGGKLVEQPVPAGYSKGLFPKVTGTSSPKRDETLKEWALVERDLMKNETKPEVIRQQQIQFYARRGVAPQEAEDVVMAGSRNGKPLTEKDVDDYNRRYPNSKVNKAELEWLKK